MIAHVAEAGEDRGRVVLHVSATTPSPVAIEAAIMIARAFQSRLESLFVEDATLFEIAALPFAREISPSGRASRPLSPQVLERQCRAAATAVHRRLEELANAAEIPFELKIVRDRREAALASACAACGPWNVVVLAEPLKAMDGAELAHLLAMIPDTTGLVVVGPHARRSEGRLIGLVEDMADLDAVLRMGLRLLETSRESRFTLLLISDNDEEARTMDDQARLAIGSNDTIEILRAHVTGRDPAVAAEIIRRLGAGFIVGRLGGLVVPTTGPLHPLASILECPILLMR